MYYHLISVHVTFYPGVQYIGIKKKKSKAGRLTKEIDSNASKLHQSLEPYSTPCAANSSAGGAAGCT